MRYFKGLNALRFFAAMLVAISHASISIVTHGCYWVTDMSTYSLFQNGAIAVEFFFVLSGFLITSILLHEIDKTGTIQIRNFYWRRIVRIWPLYYLILILYFVIVPIAMFALNSHIETNLTFVQFILYIMFLPNMIKLISSQTILSPLWSIGVEEQFYLIWAPIVKFFKPRLLQILIGIIVIKLMLNVFLVEEPRLNGNSVREILIYILNNLKFECMAIGGLGAYFIHRRRTLQCPVFHPVTQVIVFAMIGMLLLDKPILLNSVSGSWMLNNSVGIIWRSILFLYLILSVSLNKRSLIQLDFPILNRLGDISYGIYMYHVTVELVLVNIMKSMFNSRHYAISTAMFYTLFIGGTLITAYLSYHFIEKRFLKLKSLGESQKQSKTLNLEPG